MNLTSTPRVCRLAAALAMSAALTGCGDPGIFNPIGSVHGQWRGGSWGLDATMGRITLHHFCGEQARVPQPLAWQPGRTLRGIAEWTWNQAPGPDLTFDAQALPDGRLVLSVSGLYAGVDTLRRAPTADWPPVICE